jgi:predicted nucleic acid-binding protein
VKFLKVYFDTSAFAHFFLTKDENHIYSPFLGKWYCITSPFSIEEFFFNFIKKKEWVNIFKTSISDRIEKLMELKAFLAFFKVEQVDLDNLTNLFIETVIKGLRSGIVKIAESDEGLDFYDFLHLSYSLLTDVEILVTSDSGFKKLVLIKDFISAFKLKKIEIFEPTPNFNKKVSSLYVGM